MRKDYRMTWTFLVFFVLCATECAVDDDADSCGLGLEFASSILSSTVLVPGDATSTIPARCSYHTYGGKPAQSSSSLLRSSAHGEFIPRAPPSPQKLKIPKPGNQPTHK